jgi:hypothetical protein
MPLGNIVSAFGDAATGKQQPTTPTTNGAAQTEVGYTSRTGDGTTIPPEYLVHIHSTALGCTVISPMQDKLDFGIQSAWRAMVPNAPDTLESSMQLISGRSLVSTFTSRRIWQGTSPITMNLNLTFEAIDDAYVNVVAPAFALMLMASPTEDNSGPVLGFLDWLGKKLGQGEIGFYLIPPGPDPFHRRRGDSISVQFGTAFHFEDVIIYSAKPAWDFSRVDAEGWPARVDVALEIQTYEIMTKDRLSAVVTK